MIGSWIFVIIGEAFTLQYSISLSESDMASTKERKVEEDKSREWAILGSKVERLYRQVLEVEREARKGCERSRRM